MIQNISVSELNNLNDIILIDVRSIEKYNSNHIQGSINIPSNLILSNPYESFSIFKVFKSEHNFPKFIILLHFLQIK